MTAVEILKKHGVKANKSKKENDEIEKRASEIVKEEISSKGYSRLDLMLKAKARGIKYHRIMSKQELTNVLQEGITDEEISIIAKSAVDRWKSGWGNRSKKGDIDAKE